jgi:hypothetical protein
VVSGGWVCVEPGHTKELQWAGGGEILPARCHRDGGKDRCELDSSLDLFTLVVPLL